MKVGDKIYTVWPFISQSYLWESRGCVILTQVCAMLFVIQENFFLFKIGKWCWCIELKWDVDIITKASQTLGNGETWLVFRLFPLASKSYAVIPRRSIWSHCCIWAEWAELQSLTVQNGALRLQRHDCIHSCDRGMIAFIPAPWKAYGKHLGCLNSSVSSQQLFSASAVILLNIEIKMRSSHWICLC